MYIKPIILSIMIIYQLRISIVLREQLPMYSISIEEATSIVDSACKEYYSDIDFTKYEIKTYFDKNTKEWFVFYSPISKNNEYITGGGGPAVKIDRDTGEIEMLGLQK